MDSTAIVSPVRRLWLYLVGAAVMVYLVAPTLIVIPMSFSASSALTFPPKGFSLRWYVEFLSSPDWREATLISLELATFTTVVATPLATAAAYALHVGQFRWAQVMRAVLIGSAVVPVILFGVGAYFVYVAAGLVNTITGLVLADSVLTTPFALITITAGLKTYDMSQEMVARSLGASRLRAFWTVTFPQIRRSVLTGALFIFIGAFDEVILATLLSSGSRATLTNRMFAMLQTQVDPTIAAISTVMISITMLPPLILYLVGLRRRHQPSS